MRLSGTALATIVAALAATPSQAALVSACTGVSLPRSVVTDIINGPLTGIVTPLQGTVNSVLGVVGIIPLVGQVFPQLNINVAGLLTQAASGAPITLQALDINGTIVGPGDQCATTSDSFQLDTPAGIAIGGNRITGLGGEGLATASAATLGSIALGNGASTSAAAAASIAIGPNAAVTAANGVALGGSSSVSAANSVALGNGSSAARGAVAGYAAAGLAAPQTSFGEVSVGVAGGERQITNVAAGSAPTDAANVSQLTGAVAALAAAQPLQFSNPGTPTTPNGGIATNDVTLAGAVAGPVTLHNVAPGVLATGSTDAVNAGQLFDTNTGVTSNTTAITNLNNGTAGLVQQAGGSPGAGGISVGGTTGGTNVSVAGTDGTRVVSGVSAGVAPTDAANVGQLNALGASTANAVNYDVVGGVRTNTVTLAGGVAGPVTVANVAAGAVGAGSTDAVNGSQLFATNTQVSTNTTLIAGNTLAITNLTNGSTGLVQQTGGTPGTGTITVGATTAGTTIDVTGTGGGRTVTGVAAGALTAASTDAVNGGQLTATNAQVTTNTTNIATNTANIAANTSDIAGNTTAITNLSTAIDDGTVGLVQQTGGSPGAGQITVGATTGGTSMTIAGTDGNRVLTGLAPGLGAFDAATVGQLGQVVGGAFNAVQYDTDANGGRLNAVTLTGGTGAPVTVGNVAAGALTAASTDAVNGGQLAATNAQVAANTSSIVTNSTTINNIVAGNAGAFRSNNAAGAAASSATGANSSAGSFGAVASGTQSLALGNGAVSTGSRSVALGAQSTDGGVANVVSVGAVGAERRIVNVGPAVNGTDAVNLSQLQAATANFTSGIGGLQTQIDGLGFDLRSAKRRANAGTAGAMAVSALPQAFNEGRGMVGGAVGVWQDQVTFAIGVSKIVGDDTVVKAGASLSGRGSGGFNAGVGFQF